MEVINCSITFSTDVNSVALSSNPIINALKQRIVSMRNRRHAESKIDRIAANLSIDGWTITSGLRGKYRDSNGRVFTENSIRIDLIGVEADKAEYLARILCREFKQESVLMCTMDYEYVDFVTLRSGGDD